jgi:hypothetical protein
VALNVRAASPFAFISNGGLNTFLACRGPSMEINKFTAVVSLGEAGGSEWFKHESHDRIALQQEHHLAHRTPPTLLPMPGVENFSNFAIMAGRKKKKTETDLHLFL